jgi:hypothetical protein
VYVTTPGGTNAVTTIGDFFSYDPVPTVAKVSPNAGPLSGCTGITITGTGFVKGAKDATGTTIDGSVVIGQGNGLTGAIPVEEVTSVTSTSITAITEGTPYCYFGTNPQSAKAGTFGVYVTTPGGTNAVTTIGDFFSYDPVPTVTEVSPNSGPSSGGTTITITGTGFVAGATVAIGQGEYGLDGVINATVKSVTSTTITAVTGGGAKTGTFPVFVSTPGGVSTDCGATCPTGSFDFTYTS